LHGIQRSKKLDSHESFACVPLSGSIVIYAKFHHNPKFYWSSPLPILQGCALGCCPGPSASLLDLLTWRHSGRLAWLAGLAVERLFGFLAQAIDGLV